MNINKDIPDVKFNKLKPGFLHQQPNNIMIDDPASTDENPLPKIHKFTDNQWILHRTFDWYKAEGNYGNKLMAGEAAEQIDEI